jgi:hypothetical protein
MILEYVKAEMEQPDVEEFQLADGIFIKSGYFKQAGAIVPQHSHEYDHTSFIATGSVRAWRDGEYIGEYHAPVSIFIKAKCKHTFEIGEENTLIMCIHNISRNGMIELHGLHELSFP